MTVLYVWPVLPEIAVLAGIRYHIIISYDAALRSTHPHSAVGGIVRLWGILISEELQRAIKTGDNGKEKESGRLFTVDYKWFSPRLKAVKPDLPIGRATHVLRHTFGSHFIMDGGNIVVLKEILGHANIQQTMVYAPLAPDYLEHAVLLNPLRSDLTVKPAIHLRDKGLQNVHNVSTVTSKEVENVHKTSTL